MTGLVAWYSLILWASGQDSSGSRPTAASTPHATQVSSSPRARYSIPG
ncbi:hypothetical protein ACFXG4_34925 [Nocardia sp. NPDC059246]